MNLPPKKMRRKVISKRVAKQNKTKQKVSSGMEKKERRGKEKKEKEEEKFKSSHSVGTIWKAENQYG